MTPKPGLLFVRMNPHDNLSAEEFHDWYNNEHGPMRLRLDCIENGFRYRALDVAETKFTRYEPTDVGSSSRKIAISDLPQPSKTKAEWLAVYDIDDLKNLEGEPYLRLRSPPWKSQREISVMSRIDVDRRLYQLIHSASAETHRPLDIIPEVKEKSNLLIVTSIVVPSDGVDAFVQWYKAQRISQLQGHRIWRRSRIYRTSPVDSSESSTEAVVINEFASESELNQLQSLAKDITSGDLDWKVSGGEPAEMRAYELFYTFGAAPRHLSATAPAYEHALDGTKTTGAQTGSGRSKLDSYITTKDGVKLPYRLEGAVSPDAPLVVLSNSVLVDWHIWDDFIDEFLAHETNHVYRILRYETRGRTRHGGYQNTTVDLLAEDILTLLNHLRVEKAAAVIGVSLGGATVLNFALRNPSRVENVISCDTNSSSPPGNSKLWIERIAVAEEENATGVDADGAQEKIIGERLAEMTVRRWAVAESYDKASIQAKLQHVKDSVAHNSLEGFKNVVRALWDYDLRPMMETASTRALFVVGEGDGKLPKSMEQMAAEYNQGAQFRSIPGAGHLPMVEKPGDFAAVVSEFLQ